MYVGGRRSVRQLRRYCGRRLRGPLGPCVPAAVSSVPVRQDGSAEAGLSAPVFVGRRRVCGGGVDGGGH